jgi:hypothetical protein
MPPMTHTASALPCRSFQFGFDFHHLLEKYEILSTKTISFTQVMKCFIIGVVMSIPFDDANICSKISCS